MRIKRTVLVILLLVPSPVLAQHVELVQHVKDDLIHRGQTFTSNCDAFEVTRRVGWLLKDEGAQLVAGKSPAQNGCEFGGRKFSHDVLAFPGGWIDLLRNAGPPLNENTPIWDGTGIDPNAQLVAPFDPGDGPITPPPVVVVPPSVPPPVFTDDVLRQQVAQLAVELAQTKALAAEAVKEIKEHRAGVQAMWTRVAAIAGPIVTGITVWLQTRDPRP